MNEKQALEKGFTHHGSYYGIPIWIGNLFFGTPIVATKWIIFEPLFSFFTYFEILVRSFTGEEMGFQFTIKRKIL